VTGAATLSTGWCVRWRAAPAAGLRLFCLPHAGGGASAYRGWAERLAPGIEVIAVRPPGRETRFREPPFTRVEDLVPELLDAVEPWLDRPHAWYGHSLGALVAFEACRAVRRRALPDPVRLLVSGRVAPHLPLRHPPVHDAPAAEFTERLRRLDGTPREVLDDPRLLAALLPMLRADLAVSERYRYRAEPPLDVPISAYGGLGDAYAHGSEVGAWRRHTTAGCVVRMFPGGHFFPHETVAEVLPAVVADLGSTKDDAT
jgi:medium-chain acyl-[acyl-carrier-protein] hydrolase